MPSLYRRIAGLVSPYWNLLALGAVLTALFAVLDTFSFVMLFPFLKALFNPTQGGLSYTGAGPQVQWLLEHTVGVFVGDLKPTEMVTAVVILILVVYLLKNVVDFLKSYTMILLEQHIVHDLRTRVYAHMVDLDVRFFGKTRTGELLQRFTGDIDQVRLLLVKNLFGFLTSIVQVIVLIVVLLLMSLKLTILSLLVLPALFGVWGRFLRRLKKRDTGVIQLSAEIVSHLQETLSGIRLVKASSAEQFEANRFTALSRKYFKAHVRAERLRAISGPISEMIAAVGTTALLWYGARLVLRTQSGEITGPGVLDGAGFITFLAVSMRMYQPAKWLSRVPALVGPGIIAADRTFNFLETQPESKADNGSAKFAGITDALRFEHVSFYYETGRPILNDISFEAKLGQVIAIVGTSGSGKTTMADLVARFYSPTEGLITIDGTPIQDYDLKSYRSSLGIVTQDTVLFHDTVRNNIAYAVQSSDADVRDASADAHAADFIDALPEGLSTVVGERATRLSGGQRQRLAIARALLRHPQILIFDEATSSLDLATEYMIRDATTRLKKGRITFVIAHRLATVQAADVILVIEGGRIVERGAHDELMRLNGAYWRMHELQGQELPPSSDAYAAGSIPLVPKQV